MAYNFFSQNYNMNTDLKVFQRKLDENKIKLINDKFEPIFYRFSYHLVCDKKDYEPNICQKTIQEKIFIINYVNLDNNYFIICFDETVLIVEQSAFLDLQSFFQNNF